MPSTTSASQNNPDVIDGPRKRRPSERVTENGDHLSHKKAKAATRKSASKSSAKNKAKKPTTVNRRASVEDVTEPAPAPRPQPRDPQRILEASDGSDDATDLSDMPGLAPIEIDDSSSEEGDDDEPESEDDLTQLQRLLKDWDAPIYVFFKPTPTIQYIDGRKAHVFECAASSCRCKNRFIRRFLDTRDAKSTSNLHRHAKICWGDETVAAADDTHNVKTAREALSKRKDLNGSITAAFERAGKGKVTYSHRQHTKTEARAEFVRWVAESKRPFQIVNDRAFRSLMKTGRPECHIPSAVSA